jgi:hypothetical protein
MKAQIAIERPDRGSTIFPGMATGHVARCPTCWGTFDTLADASRAVAAFIAAEE